MRTVQNMIEALKKFPAKAKCYAYEGETRGVIVVDEAGEQLGVVYASESRASDDDSSRDEGPQ